MSRYRGQGKGKGQEQALAAEVGTGVEAVEEVGRLRPDLVVMDMQMPEMDGLEATRRIKAGKDAPVVIMLTLEDSAGARAEAKEAGAHNFVSKAPNVYSALEAAI